MDFTRWMHPAAACSFYYFLCLRSLGAYRRLRTLSWGKTNACNISYSLLRSQDPWTQTHCYFTGQKLSEQIRVQTRSSLGGEGIVLLRCT
ncbi:hypothetical protein B0H10DRAFT_1994267 [Mycena sp. CBHHK59/15]|nr:hypothetical protein B0H10DRAFT_1994267 [Mycena sp. CBHHK59/15]